MVRGCGKGEQGWAGTKAPFTVLQAQGRVTCFPLAALASLFGGVGWGRFVLVADTSRDHTRERRGGGSLASTRGSREERQRDKDRRQRPVMRKVNRDSGGTGTRRQAGLGPRHRTQQPREAA